MIYGRGGGLDSGSKEMHKTAFCEACDGFCKWKPLVSRRAMILYKYILRSKTA